MRDAFISPEAAPDFFAAFALAGAWRIGVLHNIPQEYSAFLRRQMRRHALRAKEKAKGVAGSRLFFLDPTLKISPSSPTKS